MNNHPQFDLEGDMPLSYDNDPTPEDFRSYEDHVIAHMMLDTRPNTRERAAFMEVIRLRRVLKKVVSNNSLDKH